MLDWNSAQPSWNYAECCHGLPRRMLPWIMVAVSPLAISGTRKANWVWTCILNVELTSYSSCVLRTNKLRSNLNKSHQSYILANYIILSWWKKIIVETMISVYSKLHSPPFFVMHWSASIRYTWAKHVTLLMFRVSLPRLRSLIVSFEEYIFKIFSSFFFPISISNFY